MGAAKALVSLGFCSATCLQIYSEDLVCVYTDLVWSLTEIVLDPARDGMCSLLW